MLTGVVNHGAIVEPVELADVLCEGAGETDGAACLHEQLPTAGDVGPRF